jgi:hypothetical protein
MLHWKDIHTIKKLRTADLSWRQAFRLLSWRKKVGQYKQNTLLPEQKRLEFARWLVTEGKLSEFIRS